MRWSFYEVWRLFVDILSGNDFHCNLDLHYSLPKTIQVFHSMRVIILWCIMTMGQTVFKLMIQNHLVFWQTNQPTHQYTNIPNDMCKATRSNFFEWVHNYLYSLLISMLQVKIYNNTAVTSHCSYFPEGRQLLVTVALEKKLLIILTPFPFCMLNLFRHNNIITYWSD